MTTYRVEIARRAVKALAAPPRREQQRVRAAIDLLADEPRPPGATKLTGEDYTYRVRVGDYRIVYDIFDDRLIVQVVRVGHRRDGLAEVERARRDGRWAAAYDGQARAKVPDDFGRALRAKSEAAAFFSTLDSRNRYAFLYRVQEAKNPETRASRIAQFVEMLAKGQRIYD